MIDLFSVLDLYMQKPLLGRLSLNFNHDPYNNKVIYSIFRCRSMI